jgi:large subunit ribosomal protein L24
MAKLHIKKGDIVYVISGESKGHQGRVLSVLVKEKRAIVEGANMVSRHTKPSSNFLRVASSRGKPQFIFQTYCWLTATGSQPALSSFERHGKLVRHLKIWRGD